MGRRRRTYHVIPYGAWTRPRMRDFREQCCDCGLVHRLDFRIVGRRRSARGRGRAPWIEFRTRRDERATAAARRRFRRTADA
ncbi:MAG TPA: hypothetical protein VGF60_04595 [Xanthobacteraceae bacterium]|jgi:hypothetical protein